MSMSTMRSVYRVAVPATRTISARAMSSTAEESIVRQMFRGDIAEKQAFPFPIALDQEALDTLEMLAEPVAGYMKNDVDSCKIDLEHTISEDVLDGLRELGLFGLQIPTEYDGLGLNNSGYARIVEEVVEDASIGVTLMAHQSIGLKGILLAGTEEQKARFLPKLATGEHMAAFCLTEPSAGSDAANIKLRATPSEDGKSFTLNGSKMWISNGGWAEIYTVFARTMMPDGKDKITAFVVERSKGGVTPGKPETKLGIRGSNTVELVFEDCVVPAENVLGEVGGGFKVAMQILNNGRFGMGAAAGAGMKKMMGEIAEHATTRIAFGKPLSDFGLVQKKFTEMAVKSYVMESMAYMTTGLIDGPGLDMSVEAAICKIYGSEALWDSVNECIQILGGMGFMAGEGAPPYERIMRDTRILLIFEGTNEILRLFVALMGIQGVGKELRATAKLFKDPVSNLGAIIPEVTKRVKRKFGIGLQQISSVSPTLISEGKDLVILTSKFSEAVEAILTKHGQDIVNQQLVLERVANITIDLFGMTSALSRASKTRAEGGASADHEDKLVKAFFTDAEKRIRLNLDGLHNGAQSDALSTEIATEILGNKGALVPHPLGV